MKNEKVEVCAICKKSICESDLYFSIEEHEKAICVDCVKGMFPAGAILNSPWKKPLTISWELIG
jgi:hypothetical protein